MLHFCPQCGNFLLVEKELTGHRFSCGTCPYIFKIKKRVTKIYPKLKDADHVMGGAAAWENVDSTDDVECPECGHKRAYFMQIQIRSGDEPMTNFYKCCNQRCDHTWRD